MFAKLKANAVSAAAAGYASAQNAAAAAKERLDIAQAAKKMVDEGGEPVAAKLLAKKAASDAIASDEKVVSQFAQAVEAYADASSKLKSASVHAKDESPSFEKLGKDYDTRGNMLKAGLQKLQQPIPEAASTSAVEKDAILIVLTKTKAANVRQSVSEKMATGSGEDKPLCGDELNSEAPSEASNVSWMQKVKSHAKGAVDATKDRVEVAKTAKKMVDDGGTNMTEKLLAKKASMDATSLDEKNMLQLAQTIEAYETAAQRMKESSEFAADESPSFSKLASDYESRAAFLKSVLSSLPQAAEAASASAEEKDGILYLVAQNKVTTVQASASAAVQEAQGKVAEAAMGKALSQATGGAVTKAPEGSGKVAVKYAKENPEQAKAAMQFAAKHAEK
eukprot:gnl/TRDRNA2_/TRDRNA2_183594_c0_seq1.p1 gnl/TRDRNA2_/TRDRNA2_183594_c0~~gnl/TRDRNA2_/TRDRNA2_183594_c0_seq1.p1  ORF type:complete len:393 (-),score=128.91 gnl/TRDRNA2_/TRDRNA2_183594_c0_seq1:126-1304(-)